VDDRGVLVWLRRTPGSNDGAGAELVARSPEVTASTPHEESTAAIFAALNPYTWRSFTPELLARRVVAACDRRDLAELLEAVPGAVVGPWAGLPEPAHREDPRVLALVSFLESQPWRGLSLHTLCRLLVGVLHDVD
jgi:hypothetical protein